MLPSLSNLPSATPAPVGVRTRMDTTTFLGALAGDHALDVATLEARARVLPRRRRLSHSEGLFDQSCSRDRGCQAMTWDGSLDCKICLSAEGALCAHLEVVDPRKGETKVDWRVVFDTADGNAVLGWLEDAAAVNPRYVAVEARGFAGGAGRRDLESYLNVRNQEGELFNADFVADGAASGETASGLASLAVRIDEREELAGTIAGSLDWSDSLHASMTVISKDREKFHVAMTADGDSRNKARDGWLGLLVRVDNKPKVDGHLSAGLDWSDALHAHMTVSECGDRWVVRRPVGRRSKVGGRFVSDEGRFFFVAEGGQGAFLFVRLNAGGRGIIPVGFRTPSYLRRFASSDRTSHARTKTWKSVVVVPLDLSGW